MQKNKSSSLFLRILLKSQKLSKHCRKIERSILFISQKNKSRSKKKTRYVHCQEVNGLTIKWEKYLRGVYSFMILSVGAPIFVAANQLQNSSPLILTIGILCLIVCCISKKWVRLLLSLPVMIGCLFAYFPSKTFSLLWVVQFFSSVTEEFFHLSQGKLHYLPEKTAFFLILLLIYLLL